MHRTRRIVLTASGGHLILVALLLGVLAGARLATADTDTAPAADPAKAADTAAAAEGEEKPPKRWTNSTELSLVVTEGNSAVQTFGLKNTLGYKANRGRARFRFDALRSDTSDDPYLLVEPGLTFLPGETVVSYSTVAVRPAATPDVARFFSEGRYDGDLKNKATHHPLRRAGA
jgi:DMSO/TMAO reductase YedYZ molybdopterin-dependent catalytic subunit